MSADTTAPDSSATRVLTPGKAWGLRRCADKRGVFKMVATDQRPPIIKMVQDHHGIAEPLASEEGYAKIAEIKELLIKETCDDATAMLLDPIWGYPGAHQHLHPDRGLLITLEEHTTEDDAATKARRSRNIAGWDVAKIKRAGADGVKLLAYYRPDAPEEVCMHQQRFVEAIGTACRAHDICFLFELLVYPLTADAEDEAAFAAKRPQLVVDSVKAFADPKFGIDVFKLESPIPASQIDAPDKPEIQRWFDDLGAVCPVPWVMLSAGASMEQFRNVLTYAYKAGASGFLAGRAIWLGAMKHYPDIEKARAELQEEGQPYMRSINELTEQSAQPWHAHSAYGGTNPATTLSTSDWDEHYNPRAYQPIAAGQTGYVHSGSAVAVSNDSCVVQ